MCVMHAFLKFFYHIFLWIYVQRIRIYNTHSGVRIPLYVNLGRGNPYGGRACVPTRVCDHLYADVNEAMCVFLNG